AIVEAEGFGGVVEDGGVLDEFLDPCEGPAVGDGDEPGAGRGGERAGDEEEPEKEAPARDGGGEGPPAGDPGMRCGTAPDLPGEESPLWIIGRSGAGPEGGRRIAEAGVP